MLMIDVLQRYLARIDRLGDDPRAVLIRHHYVFALALEHTLSRSGCHAARNFAHGGPSRR